VRKKKTNKKRFRLFGRSKKTRKSDAPPVDVSALMRVLKTFIVFIILAGIGVGFYYLEEHVTQSNVAEIEPQLELMSVPAWVNQDLEQKVYAAATSYTNGLRVNEKAAQYVHKGLADNVKWLTDIRVQAAGNTIRVFAGWRRPVATIQLRRETFYVDRDLVLLDDVPLPEMHLPEIRGLDTGSLVPRPGLHLDRDDLKAAVHLLILLERMDRQLTPEQPLIAELKTVDVTNYDGRNRRDASHIILYAVDDTPIKWGAEPDRWQRHAEAPDKDKLAKLYGYYIEYGTLQTGAKHIDLRQPHGRIIRPGEDF